MVRQNRFEATLIPLGVTSYDLTSQFERLAWNETTHPSQLLIWTSSIKMNLHAFKEQVVNALHWNTWQMHYHTHYTKKHALQVHWPASHMHDGALTCIIYTVHDNALQTQSHAMPCINMHCKALQLHEHELQWCRYIANALPVQHELQKHWYAFHCIHKHSHAVQVHKHPGVETALGRSDFIWGFGCKKTGIFKVHFQIPCLPGCAFETRIFSLLRGASQIQKQATVQQTLASISMQ